MKASITALLLVAGLNVQSQENNIRSILMTYIEWTCSGSHDIGQSLFDKAGTRMVYQEELHELEAFNFEEYRASIEDRASSIERKLRIEKIDINGDKGVASLIDEAPDGSHSVLHSLKLSKENGEWKIKAIAMGFSETVLNNEWKLIKKDKNESPNWKVYERQVKGSNFNEFKIVGKVALTPEEGVNALVEKTLNSHKYLDDNQGFIDVLSQSENEMLVYSVFNMPLLFRDRAMCERYKISYDDVKGISKITWAEDWESAPEREERVVKMPVTRGSWEFIPNGRIESIATYTVHVQPGGSMPAWMVNSTVGKGMTEEIKEMEKIAIALRDAK